MKVEVVSREAIKPSSPTPHHHRTFKLSFLDQIAPSLYIPFIFFYTNNNNIIASSSSSRRCCDIIKNSLAETLTRYYPLAGRIKDDSFIVECNDEGVDYLEARVTNCTLSQVIQHPHLHEELENQFLPFDPYGSEISKSTGFNSKVLLATQVNVFEDYCGGGIVISVCISHKIADAFSMLTFINQWAATARGATDELIKNPDFELSSLFPPRDDLMGFVQSPEVRRHEIVTKRFVFRASKIADLQKKNISVDQEYQPSSVEVVSAFLWRCFMDVNRAKKEGTVVKVCAASQSVNMRRRMVPPQPKSSFGNMACITVALWDIINGEAAEKDHQYPNLVAKLRDSINKIDNVHVRELQTTNAFFNSMKQITDGIFSGQTVLIHITSLCRFPIYEANFGWGKPIFVSPSKLPFRNLVYLIDTVSGDGIEAWVSLSKEDMAEFERNNGLILSFVSVGRSNL